MKQLVPLYELVNLDMHQSGLDPDLWHDVVSYWKPRLGDGFTAKKKKRANLTLAATRVNVTN